MLNVNGHATVFGVRRVVLNAHCKIEWYRVWLPIRPNGSRGLRPCRRRSALSAGRRASPSTSRSGSSSSTASGEPVLRSTVAIGAPGTPTPTGRYYVNQRLIASDRDGPWGPGALGISAFSDVLQEWIQGGPIAIHGTNDPSSIGHAASHGCVRLPNDVLRRCSTRPMRERLSSSRPDEEVAHDGDDEDAEGQGEGLRRAAGRCRRRGDAEAQRPADGQGARRRRTTAPRPARRARDAHPGHRPAREAHHRARAAGGCAREEAEAAPEAEAGGEEAGREEDHCRARARAGAAPAARPRTGRAWSRAALRPAGSAAARARRR